LTAPSPVTANWLAYVPEKPACELKNGVVALAHVHLVGRAAEDVGDHLRPRSSRALPLRTVPSVTTISPKMSSFTVAASLLPENWSSGFRSCDWPKLFVPESSVEPMPIPSSLPRVSASALRSSIVS
jgi:hypothetical protein